MRFSEFMETPLTPLGKAALEKILVLLVKDSCTRLDTPHELLEYLARRFLECHAHLAFEDIHDDKVESDDEEEEYDKKILRLLNVLLDVYCVEISNRKIEEIKQ